MKSGWIWIALLLVAVGGVATFFALRPEPVDVAQLLRDAKRSQRRMDLPGMKSAADAIIEVEPENAEARMIAAEAATREERLDDAIDHYSHVPESFEDFAVAQTARGELLLFRNRAREAEAALRAALSQDAKIPRANSKLAILLGAEGRRWESLPFLMQMVRSGQLAPTQQQPVPAELLYAGALDRNLDVDIGEAFIKAEPAFKVPLIGRAKKLVKENQNAEAIGLLREVLSSDPSQIEAHAQLGLLLFRQPNKFLKWHAALPSEADQHPDTWLAKGLFLREQGEFEPAIRCFGEALQLDPDDIRANYQVGQLLSQAGDSESAEPFLAREKQLVKLGDSLALAFSAADKTPHVQSIARQTLKLGRVWESAQWARLSAALEQSESAVKFAVDVRRVAESTEADGIRTPKKFQPLTKLDWKKYPLPDFSKLQLSSSESPDELVAGPCQVRFEDVTDDVGLKFSYFNSGDPATPGRLMYEYTGGGLGVIDFDRDGWPDIYCSQGREWAVTDGSSDFHNSLFRNIQGKRFQEVSETSRSDDRGFGQGVAVGDIDNDGFQDLYVANIGRNKLLLNNGDGTFSDISDQVLDQKGKWTTSCLIADLDGDGNPDLYDVNYLTGDDIFDKMCPWGSDTLRACTPTSFDGEQDQAYQNLGSGVFRRTTEQWGLKADDGKGLGIVAADFDGNGKLDLFVANDAVANSLLLNESNSGTPRFVDSGVGSGLSFDAEGHSQGCMGVAAADANLDGAMDLFVTNFYEESNTLYLAEAPGFFSDRTVVSGLRRPGFLQLGFGTQFIDGELDGLPDLVVTNGHIDDFSFEGKPHEMPPHYYQNVGKGRFRQVLPDQIGRFFADKYLGRAMVRLDWNRDGLDDIVVGHIDGTTRIVQNTSVGVGAWISVAAVGVSASRDAIGLSVLTNSSPRSYNLVAGHGYQASNEIRMTLGLGRTEEDKTVRFRWPLGQATEHELSLKRDYIIVEKTGVFSLPH